MAIQPITAKLLLVYVCLTVYMQLYIQYHLCLSVSYLVCMCKNLSGVEVGGGGTFFDKYAKIKEIGILLHSLFLLAEKSYGISS